MVNGGCEVNILNSLSRQFQCSHVSSVWVSVVREIVVLLQDQAKAAGTNAASALVGVGGSEVRQTGREKMLNYVSEGPI
jgi:hypothetical protein